MTFDSQFKFGDGIGVNINRLYYDKKEMELWKSTIGKTIKSIGQTKRAGFEGEDCIRIEFEGGLIVQIFDNGQSCCERRYMDCDCKTDYKYYIGAKIIDYELSSVESKEEDCCDVHECQFFKIKTDKGELVVANHNEHNGYYGGFSLKMEEVK